MYVSVAAAKVSSLVLGLPIYMNGLALKLLLDLPCSFNREDSNGVVELNMIDDREGEGDRDTG